MKKIVIWGVGVMAEGLEKCFDLSAAEIVCYIDSDASKQNGSIRGKKVFAPEKIREVEFDYVFISSVVYQHEILLQLNELGVEREKIILAAVTQAEMAKIFDIVTEKGILYLSHIANSTRQARYNERINEKMNLAIKRLGNPRNRSVHLYLKKYYEKSAAEFIVQNVLEGENAPGKNVLFEDRGLYFDYVLENLKYKDGLYCEFGVYRGRSINYISERIGENIIYGFDCFEGLPEKWLPSIGKGSMDENGRLPEVNENVRLIKGYFDETLPNFVRDHKGEKCSFIHIDSDLYSSAKTVLTMLKGNIGSGTTICFDEFAGHIGWQEDEYRAFMEFIEETGHEYKFVACSWAQMEHRSGERVAIEIL